MNESPLPSRFRGAQMLAVLVLILLVGTFGFHFIEGWSLFDSLYMSVVTLSTVGYQETHPLSTEGRVFVLLYVLGGLGITLFALAQLGEAILRARILHWVEKRRMGSELKAISNHFIVCGYGRMGQKICEQLTAKGVSVVVVEREQDVLMKVPPQNGVNWILGDATEDKHLKAAGIERAKGIASVFDNDADNLYVVLSARLLNPDITIISRSGTENNVEKMKKAGANRVVSPYTAGAAKISQILINPGIAEVFESVSEGKEELEMAEIIVDESSPYAGKSLIETDFSKRGIMIVGIRNSCGNLSLPPNIRSKIKPGDTLVAFGREGSLGPLMDKV